MRKYHVIKEAFLASSLIVLITFLISALPFKNEFLKGIRQDVNGFDVYDLTFNDESQRNVRDTNIVIVEIGEDRSQIVEQINLIETYQPAVLAVDAYFEQPKDSAVDLQLSNLVAKYKNLFFGSRLEEHKITPKKRFGPDSEFTIVSNFFEEKNTSQHSGFINFVGDNYSVIRTYPPFVKINDTAVPAFTSRILMHFSAEKYKKLQKRGYKESVINYSGNMPEKYTGITKEQLYEYHQTNQLSNLLKNKIILLGYFVKDPPFVLQDLHFSPLNKNIAGKGFPDMYGVVIHANILSMLIDNKYTALASKGVSFFFAFLFTFLFLCYVIHLHSLKSHPSHAWILLLQFLIILLTIYIFLQVFNFFLWKVPLSSTIISLVLCIEMLGLYKIIALWLNRKTGFITVFNKNHIV